MLPRLLDNFCGVVEASRLALINVFFTLLRLLTGILATKNSEFVLFNFLERTVTSSSISISLGIAFLIPKVSITTARLFVLIPSCSSSDTIVFLLKRVDVDTSLYMSLILSGGVKPNIILILSSGMFFLRKNS